MCFLLVEAGQCNENFKMMAQLEPFLNEKTTTHQNFFQNVFQWLGQDQLKTIEIQDGLQVASIFYIFFVQNKCGCCMMLRPFLCAKSHLPRNSRHCPSPGVVPPAGAATSLVKTEGTNDETVENPIEKYGWIKLKNEKTYIKNDLCKRHQFSCSFFFFCTCFYKTNPEEPTAPSIFGRWFILCQLSA